tara:strand:- start:51 stop:407 length:357 start_codon:yes stop_codon:yes gene_type:complete
MTKNNNSPKSMMTMSPVQVKVFLFFMLLSFSYLMFKMNKVPTTKSKDYGMIIGFYLIMTLVFVYHLNCLLKGNCKKHTWLSALMIPGFMYGVIIAAFIMYMLAKQGLLDNLFKSIYTP